MTSENTPIADDHERAHQVLVVGGGNGGLSVAGRLRRAGVADIAVVEPSQTHYYKPLFSHIAGGTARATEAVRAQAEVVPDGVEWIPDAVSAVDPENRRAHLASGDTVRYDQLILAPGIRNDWDAVPGLDEAMNSPHGASNYEFALAQKASRLLRSVRAGTVVFVQAPGPASCAGAAQKPMYQACAYWQATNVLHDIHVVLLVPSPTIFGIPEIDAELQRSIDEYDIDVRTGALLREVDAENRAVVFDADGAERQRLPYDLLIAEPPQKAPEWIRTSGLADDEGFVAVDPHTLRSTRHPSIWALGDAAGTANSKSGGALRKQTKVVAENVGAVLEGRDPASAYDGYGVCPFTVSRSTAVFAEFDDRLRLMPTLWRSSYRESRMNWIIDRRIFPQVYWHMILQGRA
ncbi:FAD-dependent oxidoreductase [Microbacterium sp.]|uniref:NAD(P)/FAD-dependent oxidoreductase n=1 Tax=Microbacterium sp. TaxID=51671 RepID=UPI0028A8B581|nr:FAD-dependent oxidoreductase [Microbacterium sp.]